MTAQDCNSEPWPTLKCHLIYLLQALTPLGRLFHALCVCISKFWLEEALRETPTLVGGAWGDVLTARPLLQISTGMALQPAVASPPFITPGPPFSRATGSAGIRAMLGLSSPQTAARCMGILSVREGNQALPGPHRRFVSIDSSLGNDAPLETRRCAPTGMKS